MNNIEYPKYLERNLIFSYMIVDKLNKMAWKNGRMSRIYIFKDDICAAIVLHDKIDYAFYTQIFVINYILS